MTPSREHKRTLRAAALLAVLFIIAPASDRPAAAAEPDGPVASKEPGWPQWRGPRRDGLSDETGLLPAWPEGGPKPLWTATGLGRGWSSPIVTGDTIYITGDVGDELRVFALDLSGKIKWQAANGQAWKGSFPGARACCAYSDGHVYNMNAHGRVACFEAATGREVWAVNVLERFNGRNLTWAVSECLLVDGPNVIVTPGGRKAFLAALNAKTGETAWAGSPLANPDEPTGYASPILVRQGGRRLLVTLALRSVVCADADNGKILWDFPKKTRHDANCATPTWWDGGIFHANPSGSGGVFLRMRPQPDGVPVEKAWECKMDNLSGGTIARDGFLYGSGHLNSGWVCMDARTGEVRYESKELVQGSLIWAEGRLYCLSEAGVVALVKAEPQGFQIISRFNLVEGKKNDVWAHPVILGRRLYLRYHDTLYAYDIAAPVK